MICVFLSPNSIEPTKNSLDNPASRYIKKRPFNTSPGSEETFRLVRDWMAECQNSHSSCPGFQPLQMPSRVLDVGTEQLPETLKVVETSGLQVAPYIALSYCWGPIPSLTALTQNIQRLKQNVEYEDLPRTLQDAVRTCRELRIRYLWVDALCIIQDDPIDSAQVISSMPQIYSQACITISASRAQGSHIGFLGERTLRDLVLEPDRIFKLGYIYPNGELGSLIFYGLVINTRPEPIEERGWTLQEKLLSARILRYGPQALLWVCKSSYPRSQYMDGGKVNSGHTINSIPKDLEEWYELVREYGTRKISVPGDRLVAVAAIAEETGKILRDRYLAGIWWSSMPKGLLWRGPSGLGVRPKKKRQLCVAPTWSWASADCVSCSTYPVTRGDFQIEVLKCDTQLKFPHLPFGAVESGQLVIRGRLKPQKYFPNKVYKINISENIVRDSETVKDSLMPEGESGCVEISWDITKVELDSLTEQENGIDFIQVQYLEFYTKKEWYLSQFISAGLFLLPSGDCFQRVGLAKFHWYLNSGDEAQRRSALTKWHDEVEPQEITIV